MNYCWTISLVLNQIFCCLVGPESDFCFVCHEHQRYSGSPLCTWGPCTVAGIWTRDPTCKVCTLALSYLAMNQRMVFVLGPHPAVLRVYSWFLAQWSLLVGSEDHLGCWGSNLGQLCATQVPSVISRYRLKVKKMLSPVLDSNRIENFQFWIIVLKTKQSTIFKCQNKLHAFTIKWQQYSTFKRRGVRS